MSFRKTFALIVAIALILTVGIGYAFASDEQEGTLPYTKPLLSTTMEQLSNRHVHPFSDAPVKSTFDTLEFDLIAQSEKIALYFNEEGDTLRILNKTTGYVWGAIPLTEARNLNKSWREYAASIVSITCFDAKNMSKRYGLLSNADTDYTLNGDGLRCKVSYPNLKIKFDFSVTLVDDHVTFEVDGKTLVEEGEYKIGTVAFMPYLGSSYENEIDGYIFIPDGSGALMRFNSPKTYISNYYKKVYGKDLAIDLLTDPIDLNCYRPNDYIVAEKQVVMPVYGIVHGAYQNALFGIIEEGAEYAAISANPAASNNRYNRVHAEFVFRQTYTKSVNRKEGAGMVVPQEAVNDVNPKLSIYLLDNEQANYDGMAVMYRDYLKEKGILEQISDLFDDQRNIPLRLELLGADKVKTIFGFGKRVFTTFSQATEIVERLNSLGIKNIDLTFKHYTANDEAGKALRADLGGITQMRKLIDLVETNGNFYFYLDPSSANYDQINLRLEAANNMATNPFKYERDNWYTIYPYTYFYRMDGVENNVINSLRAVYGKNAPFSINYLGNTLYGDFTSGKEFTRSQNLASTISLLEKLTEDNKLPMVAPNEYALPYCNAYYDMPIMSSQFLYESDTVPFLEIVLNGSVKTFGEMINVGAYSQNRLLRYVEYGVSPAFVTTDCQTLELSDTPEQDLISTCFNDWQENIKHSYDFINKALSSVYGSKITSHRAVFEGFIEICYDNDVTIYVNYTAEEIQYNGVTVEPSGYFVHSANN